MEFSINQFLKLDNAYYIVKGVTESGKPNRLARANKYGITTGDHILTNTGPDGWDVDWELAEPMDPKYAKYEKVIAKMKQLDRKFQNREIKKDLTYGSVSSILATYTINHEQS